MAAIVHYFPSQQHLQESVAKQFPVRAVEYLRQHQVPGPVFNTYGYGGYIIWALPEQKVFIDGRGDLYERGGVLSDYLQVNNLRPAAFAVLRAYRIQSCLLQTDYSQALTTALSNNPDWKKVYSDNLSTLFIRATAVQPLQLK